MIHVFLFVKSILLYFTSCSIILFILEMKAIALSIINELKDDEDDDEQEDDQEDDDEEEGNDEEMEQFMYAQLPPIIC